MVATIIIAAAAVSPNLLTEGRREKEAEMVWRGEQYERAIGLYYKKFGKYPTKVEDLTQADQRRPIPSPSLHRSHE